MSLHLLLRLGHHGTRGSAEALANTTARRVLSQEREGYEKKVVIT